MTPTPPPDHVPTPPPDLPDDPGATYSYNGRDHASFQPDAVLPSIPEPADRQSAYALQRKVGQGKFGEVWEAVQVTLQRPVAIKRLHRRPSSAPAQSDSAQRSQIQFHREALTAAQLDHPNIVPVYDMGTDANGQPLLAMKLITGEPWSTMLISDLSLPDEERLNRHLPILAQVARAVAFAHRHGIVHRDLKPSQVMVGHYGEVYLMDWGLAVSMPIAPTDDHQFPQIHAATPVAEATNPAGTLAYMAPEQTDSNTARIGPWTDVFLLGGILYNILTGSYPHPQGLSTLVFIHAAQGEVEPAHQRAPHRFIPQELAQLAAWSMNSAPQLRPQSAEEFLAALQAYLSGASRRDLSRQRTAEAQTLWNGRNNERLYSNLQQIDQLLSESLNLWPDHQEARALHQEVLHTYIQEALLHGDHRLAQIHLRRLDESPRKEQAASMVEQAIARQTRHTRNRRRALVASTTLFIAAMIFAVLHVRLREQTRAEQAHFETQRQESQREAERTLKTQQEEERRRDRTARLSSYRTTIQRLQQDLAPRTPLPSAWSQKEDFSSAYLTVETTLTTELRTSLDRLSLLRKQLSADGYTLEPEPFELLIVRGLLALHDGAQTNTAVEASYYFQQAAQRAPWRYEPYFGLAVASMRNGNSATAISHMHDVFARISRSDGSIFDNLTVLFVLLQDAHWRKYPLDPGDVLIEAAAGGTHGEYLDLSGIWSLRLENALLQSRARGLAQVPFRTVRMHHFYTPLQRADTAGSSTAHFHVPPAAQGRRNVYVTWGQQANATPVHYTIVHADGVTTRNLTQDGFGQLGPSTANLWTPLGEFRFTDDPRQGVIVNVGDDVTQLDSQNLGRAYIEAVLYTANLLTTGTALPREAEPKPWPPPTTKWDLEASTSDTVAWKTSLPAARQLAAAEQKPVLVYCFFPISSSFVHPIGIGKDYWENRMWTHRAIRRMLATSVVPVRIDLERQPGVASELQVSPSATSVVLLRPDGTVAWRITAPNLLLAPTDFLTGIQQHLGYTP